MLTSVVKLECEVDPEHQSKFENFGQHRSATSKGVTQALT